MSADHDSKDRINELEAEVQRLRAQMAEDQAASPDEEASLAALVPSRGRTIVLAVIGGLTALAAIVALTMALASGFNIFAEKAATTLAPDDGEEPPPVETRMAPAPASPAPAKKGAATPPPPRVPGL